MGLLRPDALGPAGPEVPGLPPLDDASSGGARAVTRRQAAATDGMKPARRRRLAGSAAVAIAITVIDDLVQRGRLSAGAAAASPGHVLAAEITGGVLMAAVLTLILYVIASGITVTRGKGGQR